MYMVAKMNADDIIKGLVTGVLVGFMVLYSLRPQTPYPEWVLQTYEHPWIFIVLLCTVAVVSAWELRAGAVLFIIVATLLIDYYFLGTRSLEPPHKIAPVEFDRSSLVMPRIPPQYSSQEAYPIFNNDIDFVPGYPSPF